MRSFFYNLDKVSSDAYNNHNKDLYSLCYDVKQFILKGTFTKYKKVKIILSYWGETDNYTSKMTGMKEGTVRVTRRNLSNELYEIFGYDFFNLISIGDKKAVSEGRQRLSLASKDISADKFLYRELIDTIFCDLGYSDISTDIDIKTCSMELQFLLKHSKRTIEKELSMLDKNKLIYLINMLNNEVDNIVNISNLVKCFEK